MEQFSKILDVLATAIAEGRTVTLKAEDIKIVADETVINGLEITVE